MISLDSTKMDGGIGTLWVFCVACENVVKSESFSIGEIQKVFHCSTKASTTTVQV